MGSQFLSSLNCVFSALATAEVVFVWHLRLTPLTVKFIKILTRTDFLNVITPWNTKTSPLPVSTEYTEYQEPPILLPPTGLYCPHSRLPSQPHVSEACMLQLPCVTVFKKMYSLDSTWLPYVSEPQHTPHSQTLWKLQNVTSIEGNYHKDCWTFKRHLQRTKISIIYKPSLKITWPRCISTCNTKLVHLDHKLELRHHVSTPLRKKGGYVVPVNVVFWPKYRKWSNLHRGNVRKPTKINITPVKQAKRW